MSKEPNLEPPKLDVYYACKNCGYRISWEEILQAQTDFLCPQCEKCTISSFKQRHEEAYSKGEGT